MVCPLLYHSQYLNSSLPPFDRFYCLFVSLSYPGHTVTFLYTVPGSRTSGALRMEAQVALTAPSVLWLLLGVVQRLQHSTQFPVLCLLVTHTFSMMSYTHTHKPLSCPFSFGPDGGGGGVYSTNSPTNMNIEVKKGRSFAKATFQCCFLHNSKPVYLLQKALH